MHQADQSKCASTCKIKNYLSSKIVITSPVLKVSSLSSAASKSYNAFTFRPDFLLPELPTCKELLPPVPVTEG